MERAAAGQTDRVEQVQVVQTVITPTTIVKREYKKWDKPPQRLKPLAREWDTENDVEQGDIDAVSSIMTKIAQVVRGIDIKSEKPKPVHASIPYDAQTVDNLNMDQCQNVLLRIGERIATIGTDNIHESYWNWRKTAGVPPESQVSKLETSNDVANTMKRRMVEISKRYSKVGGYHPARIAGADRIEHLDQLYSDFGKLLHSLTAAANPTNLIEDVEWRLKRASQQDGLRFVITSNSYSSMTFNSLTNIRTELKVREETLQTGMYNLDKLPKDAQVQELRESLVQRSALLDKLQTSLTELESESLQAAMAGSSQESSDMVRMYREFDELYTGLYRGYSRRQLETVQDLLHQRIEKLDDGFKPVGRKKSQTSQASSTSVSSSSSVTSIASTVISRSSSSEDDMQMRAAQLSQILDSDFDPIADPRLLYWPESILVSSLQYLETGAPVQLQYPRIGRAPVVYPLKWDIAAEPIYQRRVCEDSLNGIQCPGFVRMALEQLGAHAYGDAKPCDHLHPGIMTKGGWVPIDVQAFVNNSMRNIRLLEFYVPTAQDVQRDNMQIDSKWIPSEPDAILHVVMPGKRGKCNFDAPKPNKDAASGFPMCRNLAFKNQCHGLHRNFQTVFTSLILQVVYRHRSIPHDQWEKLCGNTLGRIMYSSWRGKKYIEYFTGQKTKHARKSSAKSRSRSQTRSPRTPRQTSTQTQNPTQN